jgi:hypothetical protein
VNRPIVEHADPGRQLIAFASASAVFLIVVTCAMSAFVVARASSPFAKACRAVAPGMPVAYFEHSLEHAGADGMVASAPDRDLYFYVDDVASLVQADQDRRLYSSRCVGEFDERGILLRSRLSH